VLAKTPGQAFDAVQASPVARMLGDHGYKLLSKTANTAIFIK
jgi:hypothetical protein